MDEILYFCICEQCAVPYQNKFILFVDSCDIWWHCAYTLVSMKWNLFTIWSGILLNIIRQVWYKWAFVCIYAYYVHFICHWELAHDVDDDGKPPSIENVNGVIYGAFVWRRNHIHKSDKCIKTIKAKAWNSIIHFTLLDLLFGNICSHYI